MQPIVDLLQKALQFFASPAGAALIAVISLLVAFGGIYYSRQQNRISQLSFAGEASSRRSKFPFDQVKSSDFTNEKILDRLLLSRADIPYVRRLPDQEYEKFREELFEATNQPNKSRLLIKGVTGIGKTREVVELIQSIDSQLPEGEKLTILIPRPDFDIPQEIPDDLRITNLLLFVNDLHLKYLLRNENSLSEGDNSFHARLERVIEYFDEFCKGYGSFRVIAVTRSEPDLWRRIQPNDLFWETFTIVDLPPLHPDCVSQTLDAVSKSFNDLEIEMGVNDVLSKKNDGTFGSIISFVANEQVLGKKRISKQDANESFSGSYRSYWDKKIYQPMIAPHPQMAKVFESLDLLTQAHIPFYSDVVEDLSACLWKSFYPFHLKKFIIRRAISEMKPWITKGEKFLTCPEAYFENRSSLEQNINFVTDMIIRVLPRHKNDYSVMNASVNLADAIEGELNQYSLSLRVWHQLSRVYPEESYIHHSLSLALFWSGQLENALLESVRTLELDPSFRDVYCVRGDILCQMGKHKAADKYYKTAIMLYRPTDFTLAWVLYERAQNLEVLGKLKQAEEHYLKALEIDDTYYSAQFALAILYRETGNNQEAKKYFDIGTEAKPQWTATLTNQAKMYLAFEQFRDAVRILTQAVETKTAVELYNYQLHYLRGVAYLGQGLVDEARSDFLEAKLLAKQALRRSRRNVDAHTGLIFAEIAAKERGALTKLSRIARSNEFKAELGSLQKDIKTLNRVRKDPVYERANQILEKRMLAIMMSQRTTEHTPLLAKLLQGRNNLASLTKLERSPLEVLTATAMQMQSDLETQQITLEHEGIRVVMSGDQKFELIDANGKTLDGLPALLNQGVQETQELAARHLLNLMYSEQTDQESENEEPRLPIPGFNSLKGLKKLQETMSMFKNDLEKEIVEVKSGNRYAKFTGDQKLIELEFDDGMDDESRKKLVEAINLALAKSQEAAAKTMMGLS